MTIIQKNCKIIITTKTTTNKQYEQTNEKLK